MHIGDIHGCYKPLAEYLGEIEPENYYIFLGDYLDRGRENAQVMELMLHLSSMENVTVLEGNHEINLRDYGLADGASSHEFRMQTAEELAKAGLTRKAMYGFYRKLEQCFLYTYHGKKVLATHGGLAKMPENLTLVATAEMIYGAGEYEDGLDVDMSFAERAAENEYQVHGHRNYEGVPVQVNEHCFNLDGGVELGGQLRALELTEEGFATVAIGNALEYAPRVKVNKGAMKSDYLYEGNHIEGFVIEDEKHFMTKIKLDYYSKWKKLRQIADTTLRHGAIKAKWQLEDEESKEFYQWLKDKVYPLRQSDGTYAFATDIIALRNRFFEDKSMALIKKNREAYEVLAKEL